MKMKGLVFFIKYIWICRKFVIIYNLKKRCKKLMESSRFRKYIVKVDEIIIMINRGLYVDSFVVCI